MPKSADTSEYAGEVVLLAFWASWCGRCELQLLQVQELHTTYRGAGLAVVGVNLDDSPAEASEFATGAGVGFPVMHDITKRISRRFALLDLPTLVLVDRGGTVRQVYGNTQVAVFLSMDVSNYFEIDSVQLRLDNKQVANYLYTEREVDGLNRGGVQRLYLGNVKFGQHELVAFFTGKGPQGRDYRRGTTITFRKGEGAKFLELRVSDRQRAQQPEFVIKEWE